MCYYQRIKDLREEMELKQADIAKMLGITQQRYARYKLGIQLIPMRHVITLADIYNTSIDYIVELTDNKSRHPKK